MTLEHIVAFAQSQSGKVYRDVCERFGVDPAATLEDELLAFQFRLALALAHPAAAESTAEADPFAAAREAGAKARAMT